MLKISMEGLMRGSLVPSALRYVDQVARFGSIQRAAKELNIAASAVNRHIMLLEHELGVALFERVARSMRLSTKNHVTNGTGSDTVQR
jgi:molybdenum-dependent DNA-binding transcriptional regulator ModE